MILPGAFVAQATPVTLLSWGPADDMVTATLDSPRMTVDGSTINYDPDTVALTPTSGYGNLPIFGGVQVTGDLELTAFRVFNNHSAFGDSNDVLDLRNLDAVPSNDGRMTALFLWENEYFAANPTASVNLGLKTLSYTGGYSNNSVMQAYFVVRYHGVGGATAYMISPTSVTGNRLAGNGGTHTIDATTASWYEYVPEATDLDNIVTNGTTLIYRPNLTAVGVTGVGLLFHLSGKTTASALSCYAFTATAEVGVPKAPFRALFNNDTGNVSLFEMPDGGGTVPEDTFDDDKLELSIDEAVDEGVDAYMLSPGYTHVPLWQSTLVDPSDHIAWWKYAHPRPDVNGEDTDLSPIGFYMEDGGDVIAALVAHCQTLGVASFVSVRLNDHHYTEDVDARPGLWNIKNGGSIANDLWRYTHPEYRIARHALSTRPEYQYYPDPNNGYAPSKADAWTSLERSQELNLARRASVLNWGIPAVVDRMFAFVEEIVTDYPGLDGIELDFLRLDVLFRDEVTTLERTAIILDFIGAVRELLDDTGRPLQKRYWLSARVPPTNAKLAVNGLDVEDMAAAGIDIFVIASNVYTVTQGTDVNAIRAASPESAQYWELAHLSQSFTEPVYPYSYYRRAATDEQLLTSAFMAHQWGMDGVSLFNYAYYRAFTAGGSQAEPPFDLIGEFIAPSALAGHPQHYTWMKTLPLVPGQTREFVMDLAPPSLPSHTPESWPDDGILRLHTTEDIPSGHAGFQAWFKGTPLTSATVPGSEPFGAPYAVPPSDGDRVRAWVVPASLLNAESGQPAPEFSFEVKNTSATETVTFRYLDLYFEP